jgi:hypothetical protein
MRTITLALFLAVSFPFSAFAAKEPLPLELMQAKTAYIELGEFIPTKKGNDHGAKAYYVDPCYETLSKWGRLKVVSDPKEADIIFHISSHALNGRQGINTTQVRGSVSVTETMTTIDVIQTSSGKKLWSGNGLWVWAFTAKLIPRNIVNSLRKAVEAQATAEGNQLQGAAKVKTSEPSPVADAEPAKATASAPTGSGSPVTPPATEQTSSRQNATAEIRPIDQSSSLGEAARQYRKEKTGPQPQQPQPQNQPDPPRN